MDFWEDLMDFWGNLVDFRGWWIVVRVKSGGFLGGGETWWIFGEARWVFKETWWIFEGGKPGGFSGVGNLVDFWGWETWWIFGW